jgi:2-dehydro-3-deoxy-D-arabinonate dehydratase
MKLYRSPSGILVERAGAFYGVETSDWDALLNRENLARYLSGQTAPAAAPAAVLSPLAGQELWAAGVTYLRSKAARMEESKTAGGGSFYDRVYQAERPEIFFKSNGWRVIPSGGGVRIRRDSRWNVPEPELVLVINARGQIVGYTIGNDMSSRDIEGENPLYLPQAKCYDGAAAIGPCVLIAEGPLSPETEISLVIERGGSRIFGAATQVGQIKRAFTQLVEFLYRETTFPHGAGLMTGTGIIPPDSFTLQVGDRISITIDAIGTLVNTVQS